MLQKVFFYRILLQEADDLAIARCLQQEFNLQHQTDLQKLKSSCARQKRKLSGDEQDKDFIIEGKISCSESSDDEFVVEEEFAGVNDFRANVGCYDDIVRYDRDGMIALQEEEIITESEQDSDDEFQNQNLKNNVQKNSKSIYLDNYKSNRNKFSSDGNKKSSILSVRLNTGIGRVQILRCPTQLPEPKFKEPFFFIRTSCIMSRRRIKNIYRFSRFGSRQNRFISPFLTCSATTSLCNKFTKSQIDFGLGC
eukprot:TRINITY_DN9294_c0_g1_i3.p2 TRINITY_DN9294_c0_g1~~TRINITY_DN9294_c0_g1_i3.p2  ORF type:complete len:252 (+),score=31.17 TRINITY_DN9294_c0_g1_i3:1-756(+)